MKTYLGSKLVANIRLSLPDDLFSYTANCRHVLNGRFEVLQAILPVVLRYLVRTVGTGRYDCSTVPYIPYNIRTTVLQPCIIMM